MAKSRSRREKTAKKNAKATGDLTLMSAMVPFMFTMAAITCAALYGTLQSDRISFGTRLIFFLVLESSLQGVGSIMMLQLARKLQGSGNSQLWPSSEENKQNDTTLPWPRVIAFPVPSAWPNLESTKKNQQPFFLNHVRGSLRFKQAMMRLGMALGSISTVTVLAMTLDKRPVSSLGLVLNYKFMWDIAVGVSVGATLVVLVFAIEWACGYIHIHNFMEVFDPNESFFENFMFEGLFHAAVSISEELPLRGWFFLNAAEAVEEAFGFSAGFSMCVAIAVQSAVFAALHLNSPGASAIGLLNLTVGGIAAAANVVLSGGLGFSLGWHFGWNITMGNVLGRSTSGIPISCAAVAVLPHPRKRRFHGGTFGPEGGVLAPLAYAVGLVLLYAIYGFGHFEVSAHFPSLHHPFS